MLTEGGGGLFGFLRKKRLFLGISFGACDELPRKVLRHMTDIMANHDMSFVCVGDFVTFGMTRWCGVHLDLW